MKAALKFLLEQTPYRIVKAQSPNRFQAIESSLEVAAKRGFNPRIVIDGGANVGDFAREALAIFKQATVHAIEPQPGCAKALDALAQESTGRVVVHKVALGEPEDAGTTLLMSTDDTATSTGAHIAHGEDAGSAGKVAVPCETLDLLLADHIRSGDRALLKLDLQGYELNALKGALTILPEVELILTEISFYRQAYEPPIETLVAFLDDAGFELYDIASVFARPRDNRARQGDFLFVRRDSPLAADTRWE